MTMLNPRVDFAFKKLFGTKENKELLISFINAIVDKKDCVKDVELLNPYNNKEHCDDKLSILDIKATDEKGRQYNIEMQISDQATYNQRALYYWGKLYTNQLQTGDGFMGLKKTISIHVLNFNCLDEEPDYHHIFDIRHRKSNKKYFEHFELHFIELEKFDADIRHIKTALDRWANFLKRAHDYDKEHLPKELKAEPAIEKAFSTLTTLYLDKDEREVYEARLKWLRDEDATLKTAQLKGEEIGEARGLEKGKKEGIAEMTKKMLLKGHTVEAVVELTDLPIHVVQKLKEEILVH